MKIKKHLVCRCGNIVETERVELGLKNCIECARRLNIQKKKGRMVYFHKTGGQIEVMSAQSYEENKKYFVPQGVYSSVKNFSKPTN